MAQAWIKRRETELAAPGAIERANRKGVTIKKMIDQYGRVREDPAAGEDQASNPNGD